MPLRPAPASLLAPIFASATALLLQLSPPVLGQTLEQALDGAYANNPDLAAGRRNLDAAGEQIDQAFANYLPELVASGGAGATYEFTDTQEESFSASTDASLQLVQPLFRGGGTIAGVDQATLALRAEEQNALDGEQQLLLEAATAYLDVWRDQGVVDLVEESRALVQQQRDGVARQKDLGAATATDLNLAETRLARIEADLIDAEAALAASRAGLIRLTGVEPGRLDLPATDDLGAGSADTAVERTLAENKELRAAGFQERSARRAVDAAFARHWPSVDLRGALQYFSADIQEQAGVLDDDVAVGRVELRVTLPLFDGWLTGSQVDEAEQLARAAKLQEDSARRNVQAETRGAWTRLEAAVKRRERLQSALGSAARVLEGTGKEYRLGRRTLIDLLDAQQELLDLQTDLRRNQRDIHVAHFELKKAMGRFTAQALNLPTFSGGVPEGQG